MHAIYVQQSHVYAYVFEPITNTLKYNTGPFHHRAFNMCVAYHDNIQQKVHPLFICFSDGFI